MATNSNCQIVEKILECPVCLEVPKSTPIYQCEKGHIHCKNCHDGLKRCPVCRSSMIKIRALVLEQVIAALFPSQECDLVECLLCHEKVKMKELNAHEEKTCKFRTQPCPNYGCDHTIQMHFDQHMQNCQYRIVKCKNYGCHSEVPFKYFEAHQRGCVYGKVGIKTKCKLCQVEVFIKDINEHKAKCDLRIIKCPNIGCHNEQQAIYMTSHFKSCKYRKGQVRHQRLLHRPEGYGWFRIVP